MAAVAADVIEGAQAPVLAAHDEDVLVEDAQGHIIADLAHVLAVTAIPPVLEEFA